MSYFIFILSENIMISKAIFHFLLGATTFSTAWIGVIIVISKFRQKKEEKRNKLIDDKINKKLDEDKFNSYKKTRELLDEETTRSIENLDNNLKLYHKEVKDGNKEILSELKENRKEIDYKIKEHKEEYHYNK